MSMQRYELEAWLGDDHGLAEDQLEELLAQADGINARFDGDQDRAREGLTVAYRLMRECPTAVVADLAQRRDAARAAELDALAGLQQAAITLIERGDATESGFARQAGVDRMTVRKWLGK
ncbi:hypothetical protein [Streptomyces sp. NBC_00063]|uniref:hypothetical protein n=1 Tax=Streptomyces sp. NBC_00063 TaxID=2975638 RepID=UPI00224DE9CC|nr:hypothetical protein [Streptomyces sp. NBC_00063]MCX5441247.1 hypothetical protein [Streptomyces sp. NBC_00063]